MSFVAKICPSVRILKHEDNGFFYQGVNLHKANDQTVHCVIISLQVCDAFDLIQLSKQ